MGGWGWGGERTHFDDLIPPRNTSNKMCWHVKMTYLAMGAHVDGEEVDGFGALVDLAENRFF